MHQEDTTVVLSVRLEWMTRVFVDFTLRPEPEVDESILVVQPLKDRKENFRIVVTVIQLERLKVFRIVVVVHQSETIWIDNTGTFDQMLVDRKTRRLID